MKKKLWIIPFIWVIALAWCTQTSEVNEENNEENMIQDQSQEEISQNDNVEIIEINTTYWTPDWAEVPLNWRIFHENWIIKTVEIDAVNWRQEWFNEYVSTNLEWQKLEWLKVDTVSRASLVTQAFNDFVSEIY